MNFRKNYLLSIITFVLFLCFSTQESFAQIAKINSNLTEQDTQQVLELLGITVADLPMKVKKGSYYIDFFIDEYEGKNLIESKQFFNSKTLEEFENFAIASFLPKVSDTTSHLKVYSARKNDSLEVFKVKAGKISWIKKLQIDPNEDYKWKTFLDKEIKTETKIPVLSLFTIWDQNVGNSIVRRACLPNLPPEELGEVLSHYFVFSIKLVSKVK